MNTLTKAQRKALKRVFDRCPIYRFLEETGSTPHYRSHKAMTYREFRKTAVTSFGCVMVQWCGMWLGIETDGYTHS